jgi:aquaporin NIP
MKDNARRWAAEGLGTFGLVFAGTGAVVANDLSGGAVTHIGVSIVFGAIVMVMVVAFGPVSGAHINPAVTLGFWLARQFEGREVLPYIASQCAGAIAASATLKALYPESTSLGATLPIGAAAPAFAMEVILTTILMLVIMACAVGHRLAAVAAGLTIGATVALCALFGGPLTGASMNPARSLGPALISGQTEFIGLYWLAPIFGASLAVGIYRVVWAETTVG